MFNSFKTNREPNPVAFCSDSKIVIVPVTYDENLHYNIVISCYNNSRLPFPYILIC